jgi:hypothetical protein
VADPRELGGLLWERDAELAFSHNDEIEKAAEWCRRNGPHKFEFLNQLRKLLQAEESQMHRLGLTEAVRTGAIKRTPVLTILSPSQALRLLECYKRAVANSPKMWRAKDIHEMHQIEADARRDAIIARIRELRKRNAANSDSPRTV